MSKNKGKKTKRKRQRQKALMEKLKTGYKPFKNGRQNNL